MINYLFILDGQFIIEIISVANIVLYKSYYSYHISSSQSLYSSTMLSCLLTGKVSGQKPKKWKISLFFLSLLLYNSIKEIVYSTTTQKVSDVIQ